MKWGGLLAVNQGCKDEARAITLHYNGGKKGDKPVVLIGKGIIFDTGGYSLKLRSMEVMKLDMAGAADVLGIFAALKKLGIKKNVIGIIAAAENMVNENAYRPSDVITMYSGKTVEVLNTDAEGRLVLADALHHALSFDPKKIITIATLTGAVQTSLSTRYVGLLGNDNSLRRKIQKAGREVDELGWPLPIHGDYRKRLKSDIADLKNC
ncbi:leucyl aminopeptidase family protein, partial [Candidatus Gracilibacteria bacterium]|nr:leucyl aminopeptidase family protein [Candidatus Gracilibacteria bacterium]